VLESASVYQPFPARLEEANRNLARLSAMKTGPEPERPETAKRFFKEAEARDPERLPRGALLAVGLLLAGAGIAWFGSKALLPGGGIHWSNGRWGLVTFALGLALWAAGAFHG
jgi:hypothetical protein